MKPITVDTIEKPLSTFSCEKMHFPILKNSFQLKLAAFLLTNQRFVEMGLKIHMNFCNITTRRVSIGNEMEVISNLCGEELS